MKDYYWYLQENEEGGINAKIGETLASAGERLRSKDKCLVDEKGDNAPAGDQVSNLGCAILTCAKWCPLENCTILVLGKHYKHMFF